MLKNDNQQGAIRYVLQALNDDGTNSVVPTGMTIDSDTGEIAKTTKVRDNRDIL